MFAAMRTIRAILTASTAECATAEDVPDEAPEAAPDEAPEDAPNEAPDEAE